MEQEGAIILKEVFPKKVTQPLFDITTRNWAPKIVDRSIKIGPLKRLQPWTLELWYNVLFRPGGNNIDGMYMQIVSINKRKRLANG